MIFIFFSKKRKMSDNCAENMEIELAEDHSPMIVEEEDERAEEHPEFEVCLSTY